MIANDSDYEADDTPSDLLQGLEELALALDAQHYPGPARPLAPLARPQRRGRRVAAAWGIVTGIVTAAGIGWATIMLRPASGPSVAPLPAALAAKAPPAPCPASGKLRQMETNLAAEHGTATENASLHDEQAIPGNEVAECDSPQVVVVEDLDSYSLIDLSGNSPVVSYMSKDASSMDCPVPVPLGVQLSQDAYDRML